MAFAHYDRRDVNPGSVESTTIFDYAWAYDTAGRVTSTVHAEGTDTFTYDDGGQLTATDSDYQTDESYSYDSSSKFILNVDGDARW